MSKQNKGNQLNMHIAKTHRYGNQLVGLQLTSGNVIAICLSVAQIVAGLTTITWTSSGGMTNLYVSIPACIFVGGFGAFLALLIERFSLGGLKSIYTANKLKQQLEDDYYGRIQRNEIPQEKREEAKFDFDRLQKRHKHDLHFSIPVVIVGVLISGSLGDVFWHTVFASTGPILVWPLSIGVAGVISLTFVYSELYKDIQDKSLKETVSDTELFEDVLIQQRSDIQLDVFVEAISNIRTDPTKREKALLIAEESIINQLTNFSTRVVEEKQAPALNTPEPHKALPPAQSQTIEGEFREAPTTQSESQVSIQLPRITPLPVSSAPQIPDDPKSDEQIALQVVHLDAFSTKLFKHIAHVQALRTAIFEIIEAYQDWQDSVPEVAQALRLEAPDVAEEITDERVTAIVDKMVHEMDTEPLDTPQPRPLGEMLGLNTREDYRRVINKGLAYLGYSLRETDTQDGNPATDDVVDAHTEQESEQQVNTSVSNVSRAVSPATAQPRPRRQYRKVTGVQGTPRSKMDAKMTRKLERILTDDPGISNNQLGAQLGVSPNTAKKYREMLTNQQA